MTETEMDIIEATLYVWREIRRPIGATPEYDGDWFGNFESADVALEYDLFEYGASEVTE
jgi:hypothetical protein